MVVNSEFMAMDYVQLKLSGVFGRLIASVHPEWRPNLSVSALSGNLMYIDSDETLH